MNMYCVLYNKSFYFKYPRPLQKLHCVQRESVALFQYFFINLKNPFIVWLLRNSEGCSH